MKTRIALFALFVSILAGPISGFAQGQGVVSFTNLPESGSLTDDKRIFVFDEDAGTMVRAAGTGYRIALYWAPAGVTDEASFMQIGAPGLFLTGTAAGAFFGGGRTIQTPTPGPVLAFQCRAWAVAFGDSYEGALATGLGFGKSPVFELKTKDPLDMLELAPRVGSAPGFRGFAIVVPEPSIICLVILGLAGALRPCRRKQVQ